MHRRRKIGAEVRNKFLPIPGCKQLKKSRLVAGVIPLKRGIERLVPSIASRARPMLMSEHHDFIPTLRHWLYLKGEAHSPFPFVYTRVEAFHWAVIAFEVILILVEIQRPIHSLGALH